MQLLLIAEPDNRAEPVDSRQEEAGRGHRMGVGCFRQGWGAADRGQVVDMVPFTRGKHTPFLLTPGRETWLSPAG